jgi:Cu(I)-responsive transcriptional regulator
MTTATFSIGAIATATGAKVETIRYYERIGLLPKPERTASNYRAYGEPHVARLSFIRRARELGFTLEQVRALLDLSEREDRECCAVDAIAQDHLDEVDRKIADLETLRRELRGLIGQCSTGVIGDCRIIAALSPA